MIEIAFSACLMATPYNCRPYKMTFEESAGASLWACMMNGQIALSQWAGEHPNWRIEKWSCLPAGQVAKI